LEKWTPWHINRLVYGLLFACTLSLGGMVLAPAMAHGTEAHVDTPAPSEDGMNNNAAAPQRAAAPKPMSAHSLDNSAHSHDGNDNHEDVAGEDVHDHSTHAPSEALLETGFGRFLFWLGKLHPAAVHFPIALLLGAALAELISLRRNAPFFRDAGRFCLWLGTLSAVGAALLGWFYGGFRLVDDETILTFHRWNGTGIAMLALLTLWLLERGMRRQPSRRSSYRIALLVIALMVGTNGYLGGLMVYGPEQHQWPEAPAEHPH